MKRFLLSLLTFATLGYVNSSHAQCTLSSFNTVVRNLTTEGSDVNLTFDISFNLAHNNGNKYIYIDLWKYNDYSSFTYTFNKNSKGPNRCDLDGGNACSPTKTFHPTLLNIGIDNNSSSATYKKFLSVYAPDNTVILKQPSSLNIYSVQNGTIDSFVITGVTATVPANLFLTGGSNPIKGVIWSSQAASSTAPVACSFLDLVFLSDPTVSGKGDCGTGQYTLNITHTSIYSGSLTGNYNIYADNGDGVFTSADESRIVALNQPFSVNTTQQPSGIYTGSTTYTGFIPSGYRGLDLWAKVTTSTGVVVLQYMPTIECTVTPVKFKSFNADRKNSSTVTLKWTTASEQNNRGFYIQRNIGGEWKNIAFVFSQADGGNSASDLTYEYFDANLEKGISQYRIQQVDIDSKATFSDIRAVRGEGTANKVSVYPNPSFDGKVNLVFENSNSIRDVQVSDMQGRVVKIYKEVRGNVLIVEKLSSGFYTLKVTDRSTAVSSVEKVVVK